MDPLLEEDEDAFQEDAIDCNTDSGFDDHELDGEKRNGPLTLITLPEEVLHQILENVSLTDIESLSHFNNEFNEILIENLCKRYSPSETCPFIKLSSDWPKDGGRPILRLELVDDDNRVKTLVGPVTVFHNHNSAQNAVSVLSRALDGVIPKGLQLARRLHVNIEGGADHHVLSVFETLFTDGGMGTRCITLRRMHRFINLQRLNNVFKKAAECRLDAHTFYGTPWSRDLEWRRLVFEGVSFRQYAALLDDSITLPRYKSHRVTLLMDTEAAKKVRENKEFSQFLPKMMDDSTTLALEIKKFNRRPLQSFDYRDMSMEIEELSTRSRANTVVAH